MIQCNPSVLWDEIKHIAEEILITLTTPHRFANESAG